VVAGHNARRRNPGQGEHPRRLVGRGPAPRADVLYLSFARNAPTGATFLTFELNRSGRTWTNDNNETIPCRRDGDILVSYEISGNAADVFLRRWHTDVTDPEAGCDRRGTIQPFTAVKAAVEAQGAINSADIANHLPGHFGTTIPAAQFGEAALDLEALLGPAFESGCYAFNSIWMHSRSSLSYESQMQDYVAPTPITLQTCSAEGTKFFDPLRTACATRTIPASLASRSGPTTTMTERSTRVSPPPSATAADGTCSMASAPATGCASVSCRSAGA
jgi:hypothetical protein